MRARYLDVTGPMLKNVAKQVGDATAEAGPDTGSDPAERPQIPTETET